MDETVNSETLAKVLKITARRVRQLVEENVIFRETSGNFNLANSVENYYENKFKPDENDKISEKGEDDSDDETKGK